MKVAAALLLTPLGALAGDFTVGGAIGYGRTYAPVHYSNIETDYNDKSVTWQAFAAWRTTTYAGLEVGYLRLPSFVGDARTSDYPAYKGLPAGTYPQTAETRQEIKAKAWYGRVNVFYPARLAPYAFLGLARVIADNDEHAIYNGTDEAHFREHISQRARYFGAGLQHEDRDMTLRLELGRIPNGTTSPHTLERTYTMILLGIGYAF